MGRCCWSIAHSTPLGRPHHHPAPTVCLAPCCPPSPRAPRTGQQWNEAPMGASYIPTFSIGWCGQGGQGASTHLPTMADPPWQRHRHVPAQPWQAAAPALPAPGLRQPAGLCQGEGAPGLVRAGGRWLSGQLPSQGFPGWPGLGAGLRPGGWAAEGCVCGAGRMELWAPRSDSPRSSSWCWKPACSQPRDWAMGWVSICRHQGWAPMGVGHPPEGGILPTCLCPPVPVGSSPNAW